MTLTAEELRIGNLVYNSHGGIHAIGCNCFHRFRYPSMDGNPSGFKPIPLTEEILLKCGFEKDDTGLDMFDQDYHEWCQKEFPIIGVLCQNETKEYLFDENTDTLRIRYLHQLQNLFYSLVGEELEVSL